MKTCNVYRLRRIILSAASYFNLAQCLRSAAILPLYIISIAGCSSSDEQVNPAGYIGIGLEYVDKANIAGTQEREFFRSSITKINYPLDVYLPPKYDDSSDSYPVIYVTDGEWRYGSVAQEIINKGLDVIVVAIGNSDEDGQGRRVVDYLLPGARQYYAFITTELLPYIETKYRTMADNRSLFGHSLGGQFVVSAYFLEENNPTNFHYYIAADPALDARVDLLSQLIDKRANSGKGFRSKLIITGATARIVLPNDYLGYGYEVEHFHDLYPRAPLKAMNLTKLLYYTSHMGVVQPSISDSLDLIFTD